MKRAALLLGLALASATAHAEDVAGTLQGGLGIAWRNPDDAPPFDQLKLEYDTGTLAWIEAASRYDNGFLLRASYSYTYFDSLSALGNLVIEEDIQQHDARLGAFWAPLARGPVDPRIGAGYLYAQESAKTPGAEADRVQDGGFAEAGVTWRIARGFSLDTAVSGFKVDGERDYDAESLELRLAASIRAGTLDFIVGARYADVQRENLVDEDVIELRLGLGGAWGWIENRS